MGVILMTVMWIIEEIELRVTKHFALKYMRKWGWDFKDLRDAIREAYKINKLGKNKFEIYIQKSGFKKIIVVHYDIEHMLVCITGSDGGGRK